MYFTSSCTLFVFSLVFNKVEIYNSSVLLNKLVQYVCGVYAFYSGIYNIIYLSISLRSFVTQTTELHVLLFYGIIDKLSNIPKGC